MTQSYFDNIDLHLMSALMSAQHSIRAAVAWCTNATKRTFYMRENLGIEFDQFCATARIDKGALLNLMVKEWLEQNRGRVEFEIF